METYQLALQAELENETAPIVSIGVGRGGNTLIFGADPATGLISVASAGTLDLEFFAEDFDLINDLLQRALGN